MGGAKDGLGGTRGLAALRRGSLELLGRRVALGSDVDATDLCTFVLNARGAREAPDPRMIRDADLVLHLRRARAEEERGPLGHGLRANLSCDELRIDENSIDIIIS